MRTLALLLLISSPAWATVSLVQHKTGSNASGTTVAITVTSTGSGNAGIVAYSAPTTAITISSVSGGGTYSHCSGNDATVASASSDMMYTLNTTSGATTITLTLSGTATTIRAEYWEVSGTSLSLDVCGHINNSTNTNRSGVGLTLTGSNDFIAQAIGMGNGATSASAITGAYTIDDTGTQAAYASALNTAVGTAPTWTFNQNSLSAGSAIALKEAGASAAPTQASPFVVFR